MVDIQRSESHTSHQHDNVDFEGFLEAGLAGLVRPMLQHILGPDAPEARRKRILGSLVREVGRGSTVSTQVDDDEIIDQLVTHLATNPSTREQLEYLIASNLFRSPRIESMVMETLLREASLQSVTRRITKYIHTGRTEWVDAITQALRNRWKLMACIVLFLVVLWLPRPVDLTPQGHRAIAIFSFTAALWITESLPLAVSALIGCALCAIFQVAEPQAIFAGFGSHVVLFLVGTLMIGIAVSKVGLHKRISFLLLSYFGKTPGQFLFGVGLLGCTMSMLMPLHCVVAMLVPVMLATIAVLPDSPGREPFCTAVLLNLSYCASIGSLTTLMGGGRNPLAIALYQEHTGEAVSFVGWTVAALPIVITMFIFSQLLLRWMFSSANEVDLKTAMLHMKREVRRLGPFSSQEIIVSFIVLLAIILWVTVGILWGLAVVAVIASSLLFILKILRWRDIEKEFPWALLFLYGGAVSLAGMVHNTGATVYLAEKILDVSNGSPWLFILLATVVAVFLTEVVSNAACLAILLPVLLTLASSTGQMKPMGAMYLIAFATGLAFMLPISTPGNALVYASGRVSVRSMIKCGFWLNIAGIVILMTVGCLWWKLIGVM